MYDPRTRDQNVVHMLILQEASGPREGPMSVNETLLCPIWFEYNTPLWTQILTCVVS